MMPLEGARAKLMCQREVGYTCNVVSEFSVKARKYSSNPGVFIYKTRQFRFVQNKQSHPRLGWPKGE